MSCLFPCGNDIFPFFHQLITLNSWQVVICDVLNKPTKNTSHVSRYKVYFRVLVLLQTFINENINKIETSRVGDESGSKEEG